MRLLSSLLTILPVFSALASATALTYKLAANEKACFFTEVERQNAKVAFYFAVRLILQPTLMAWSLPCHVLGGHFGNP